MMNIKEYANIRNGREYRYPQFTKCAYDVEKGCAELEEKQKQRWVVLAERDGYVRAIEIVRDSGKE